MEQDILDRLYYGKIVPGENRRGNTPEMDSLSGQVDQDIQWLKRALGDKEDEVLGRLLENASELERLQVCEGFKDGFRLGIQLIVAGLGGEKQP